MFMMVNLYKSTEEGAVGSRAAVKAVKAEENKQTGPRRAATDF